MKVVKVFTRYDEIPDTLVVPYIRKLTRAELLPVTIISGCSNQTGFIMQTALGIKRIIYGLEGVKFVHYGT